MRVEARVVNLFKDIEHDGHVYKPGDVYPAEGYEADPERVDFLSNVHPKLKRIFLANIELIKTEEEKTEREAKEAEEKNLVKQKEEENFKELDDEYPKHTGGGWYELSNGEKTQGKEEALEEEAKLKSGD